ncbi:MAG TPA: hypothetical protein DCO71_10315 [Gammaproteobacteria bacterium]|nr:hypothetical protein [Gammaproteobacteria bacterium]
MLLIQILSVDYSDIAYHMAPAGAAQLYFIRAHAFFMKIFNALTHSARAFSPATLFRRIPKIPILLILLMLPVFKYKLSFA